MFAQPLFLHRSWRWRPRPDCRLLLMLFGVSVGGCGDTSRPGTLGALLGERRSAEEAGSLAGSVASSELDPLHLLGGEDLKIESFLCFPFVFFLFFFFSSEGAALLGKTFDSITGWGFLVPFGSFFTVQFDSFRRELSSFTLRRLFLKAAFIKLADYISSDIIDKLL